MDNSLKTKEKPPKREANAPSRKGKTKTFLIGNELKTKDLHHTAAERASGPTNKTQPKTRIKTPDSRPPRGESSRWRGSYAALRPCG